MANKYPLILGCGRTSGNVNVPLRVGSDGTVNGSGVAAITAIGPASTHILCGKTAGGVTLPLLVDASGLLQTTT